ncbi:MAG TPA: TonB family protein [Chthoniobacteraceae bacterium]|nr:TonB family protein [Chthoniobacteraceae bacterium]
MADDSTFKRRLIVVALLHVIAIGVFFFAGQWPRKTSDKEVIAWIDGSIGGGETPGTPEIREAANASSAEPSAPELIKAPPEIIPEPPPPPVERQAPSEIVTATPPPATPLPATPKSTPKSTPKPTPVSPKPDTPKPTPKPKPSPTPTPKPKPSPKPGADDADEIPKPKSTPSDKPKGTPSDKPKTTPGAAKTGSGSDAAKQAFNSTKTGGNGPGSGNGKGPAKSGDGEGLSKFGWYFAMLKDRFTSRWDQPTNIERNGSDVTATLKVRISKDGVISNREIVQSSGFPQMDESVLRAAEKVVQTDPLPAGLGNGEFFEVNVQFKLE